MIIIKKCRNILGILAVMIGLSGCNTKVSPEELIKPPRLSEEDEKINTMIDESLPEDAKLENISSKDGMSAIKKQDINGNGSDEILVFYSIESENSLHMVVFEEIYKSYDISLDVKVPGQFFEEVLIEDIAADGVKEILVNTSEKRVQNGNYRMNIYSYTKDPSKFFEIEYNKYALTDLNEDGKLDIVILNKEERAISIDYYRYNENSQEMEFINETIIDNQNVVDMNSVKTDGGNPKISLELENSLGGESEKIFLSIDKDGKLKIEED